jgi:hypothetical protein
MNTYTSTPLQYTFNNLWKVILMMGAKKVSEALDYIHIVTRLIALHNFIVLSYIFRCLSVLKLLEFLCSEQLVSLVLHTFSVLNSNSESKYF